MRRILEQPMGKDTAMSTIQRCYTRRRARRKDIPFRPDFGHRANIRAASEHKLVEQHPLRRRVEAAARVQPDHLNNKQTERTQTLDQHQHRAG